MRAFLGGLLLGGGSMLCVAALVSVDGYTPVLAATGVCWLTCAALVLSSKERL
jgi:hypothetical protein